MFWRRWGIQTCGIIIYNCVSAAYSMILYFHTMIQTAVVCVKSYSFGTDLQEHNDTNYKIGFQEPRTGRTAVFTK